VLKPYLPEHFDQVAAFARDQPEFDYLKAIIRVHDDTRGKPLLPGKVWVWTIHHRVVAVCGLAYTNARDGWLYGMRVDDKHRGQGIATRFTRALFDIAREAECSWVGLDTMDTPHKAPVFRIARKLGMTLEAVHTTFVLKNQGQSCEGKSQVPNPKSEVRISSFDIGISPPGPSLFSRASSVCRRLRDSGEKVMMRQDAMLWRWFRLIPRVSREVSRDGYSVNDVPVHIAQDRLLPRLPRLNVEKQQDRPFERSLVANLFSPVKDCPRVLPDLLALARNKGNHVVIVLPSANQKRFLAAVRALIPGLRLKRDYWLDSWRIYGKYLSTISRTLRTSSGTS